MPNSYDYAIVGGGIIGLSLGLEILNKFPGTTVLVLEKESSSAQHSSGRNSGVLHAGFYYSPESLKARFCAQGNQALREIITQEKIPILECGKVVVAQSESDLPRLESLMERGIANGVDLRLLDESELPNYEPLARTYSKFLWSPTTAVSDPMLVTRAIQQRFQKAGGEVKFNSHSKFTTDGSLTVNGDPISAKFIVNAAGGSAIHLAHSVGVGLNYSQLPILGLYKVATKEKLGLQRLVYPVPNPVNPFLGVHFTLTVDGSVKIGPTAIPILGREQYELKNFPDLRDLKGSFSSIKSMLIASPKNLMNLARTELPKISTKTLVRSGEALVPNLSKNIVWKPKKPGIRAQLVNQTTGEFEMDYVVQKSENQLHILNAVSPGWTSAIPFAQWVVKNYL